MNCISRIRTPYLWEEISNADLLGRIQRLAFFQGLFQKSLVLLGRQYFNHALVIIVFYVQ